MTTREWLIQRVAKKLGLPMAAVEQVVRALEEEGVDMQSQLQSYKKPA